VPLVLGGNTPVALSRAARCGDGWSASGNPTPGNALQYLDAIRAAEREQCRTTPLTTYVRVSPAALDDVERFEAAGVNQMIFWPDKLCRPARTAGPTCPTVAEALSISALDGLVASL